MPPMSPDCPSTPAEYYSTNSDHQPSFSVWIWNTNLAQPNTNSELPANTWVEFIHQKYPMDGDATWMYYAPGTAIWFNTGTTQSWPDHDGAVTALLTETCDQTDWPNPGDPKQCIPQFPRLYKAALAKGLNSLQFSKHGDQICGSKKIDPPIRKLTAHEIVDLSGPGTTVCGSNSYRTGWEATATCNCDEKAGEGFINCAGYGINGPSLEVV